MTTVKRTLPGPKGHWFAGNVPEFARDRLGFLDHCFKTYGDVYALRFGPRRRVMVVNHPDLVEEVLVANNRHFHKHFALKMTQLTLGNGLLTSEGDFWRKQRKLVQPAFHREKVARHAAVMVRFTERMLESWSDGQRRDVQDDMMRLTLEIVAKTLFDAEVADETAEASAAMETLLRAFTARVGKMLPLPEWIPTPTNLRLKRAIHHLDQMIFQMIMRRRSERKQAPRDDLLSMLLSARDDDDEPMSDRQLRDEAMTLFLAGHETTANTLAWVWFLLSSHPEAEARLHEELGSVLGTRPPTFDDLPRLTYTESVVNEALRLYPTVWLVGREAIEPCRIGEHDVSVGTTVYMSQWVIHRDGRFFDDPLAYRPERWGDGLIKRLPRYAFFPFGGGPRICVGNAFAMMEAVLLLATIARRYRVKLAPGEVVAPLPTMTLRPVAGMKVTVERRGSAIV